ncbi:hypothetical protein [Methanosphaerula palustris]|uniref:DUF4145 domain-containing protein n=1 Tax=Methanosphaerula palustris (strain ATCC BAA-1556 / DSM 19958 / E1-9c) TaxID=521011 RepID=B8GF18_METPE|nr:hypothetical protein [Methanosphaerula palustris]ACL17824.1 conserved hypothetical protein [Methanosphaerula palustris E1-9c]
MSDIDYINREIDELERLACKTEEAARKLLYETPLSHITHPYGDFGDQSYYIWQRVDDDQKENQRIAIRDYERYYSVGLHFIKEFRPEKEREFSECYESGGRTPFQPGIMDYLKFRHSQEAESKVKIIDEFVNRFEIQRSILYSVPYVAKISEHKLRDIISGDYIEREIEQSEYLYEKGFERAAGALAGVALEQYLRTQCDKNQIDYNKKETMVPLVQKLYDENKIDLILKKKIEHLASIRNFCDHPFEVNKGQVKELIENVKKIV